MVGPVVSPRVSTSWACRGLASASRRAEVAVLCLCPKGPVKRALACARRAHGITIDPLIAFRDFEAIHEVWPRLDLLVYTPEEFSRMRAEGRAFIQHVLDEGAVVYEASRAA